MSLFCVRNMNYWPHAVCFSDVFPEGRHRNNTFHLKVKTTFNQNNFIRTSTSFSHGYRGYLDTVVWWFPWRCEETSFSELISSIQSDPSESFLFISFNFYVFSMNHHYSNHQSQYFIIMLIIIIQMIRKHFSYSFYTWIII